MTQEKMTATPANYVEAEILKNADKFLALETGRRVIQKSAECPRVPAEFLSRDYLPGITPRPHARAS